MTPLPHGRSPQMRCRPRGKDGCGAYCPSAAAIVAILFVWLLVEPRRVQETGWGHASPGNAGRRLRQWGALMKWAMAAFLAIATAVLVAVAWLQSGGLKQHCHVLGGHSGREPCRL